MSRSKTEKYEIDKMCKVIEDYTDQTELPILKEVCCLNNWNYDYVIELKRDNEELSRSIKRLLCKKEVNLETGILTGKYNVTAGIFSLKQLGWHDHKKDETSINRVVIVNDLQEDSK